MNCRHQRNDIDSKGILSFIYCLSSVPIQCKSPTDETFYTAFERQGVIALVAGGFISFIAVLCVLFTLVMFSKKYSNTHLILYFGCLLLADAMQALASIMSLNWVQNGGVYEGTFCAVQGGLKQAGNVGAALWTYTIAFHLFNLLFLRYQTSKLVSWGLVVFGWSFVATIVFAGLAAQTPERGPYWGISGEWCWITKEYHLQQILLQYLFEGLSVLLSSFFYIATLLRVRGNLLKVDGRWTLRFLSAGDSWRLDFGRDFTDSASLRLIQHMIWYPVAYAVLIIPIAIVRLRAFAGTEPSFAVTVFADFIFNLSGFVDVALFFTMSRIFPEPSALPEFTARRKTVNMSVIQYGITPFSLDAPAAVHPHPERLSVASMSSINSQTPLRP
ncbi:hypothetical protein B0H11DRAFT_485619 [Mycena galericulata]|nr:hypothetical protein B0H11DRAFT_485619 [Mycena galericulata]